MCVRSSAQCNWGTVLLQCLIFTMGGGTAERVPPLLTIHAACAIAQFELRLIHQSQICQVQEIIHVKYSILYRLLA